jgi:hypothetical protein
VPPQHDVVALGHLPYGRDDVLDRSVFLVLYCRLQATMGVLLLSTSFTLVFTLKLKRILVIMVLLFSDRSVLYGLVLPSIFQKKNFLLT